MAIDTVLFDIVPVTVLTVKNSARFMERLVTSDVAKMAVGSVERTVMMNATGGVIDTLFVARTELDCYKLLLVGESADVREAWIRQMSVAFDSEVQTEKQSGFHFVGNLPIDGIDMQPKKFVERSGMLFVHMGWMQMVVGAGENIEALSRSLQNLGAKKGEQSGLDALRILAREPALGLELDESVSPLESGLIDAVDFNDPNRIFLGRALCEARFNAGGYERLHLVAFDTAFDPMLLVEAPLVVVGDMGYPLTSLARIPEMPLTVGLVRLPYDVQVGQHFETIVRTDPRTNCGGALVIDPQL
jgi:aminomethyltransferase